MIRRVRPVPAKASRAPQFDYPLLIVVGALLAIGLMMVYSTTFDWGYQEYGDPTYFVLRQGVWLLLGLGVMWFMMRLDYTIWRRFSIPLMGIGLALLAAVLLFGQVKLGAQRAFFNGSIQPSELLKLIVVIYIADWLSSKGEKIRNLSYGLVPFAVLIGAIAGLIVTQPDFGTAIVIVLVAGTMFFLAGADIKQIMLGLLISTGTFLVLLSNSAHAHQRIQSYLDALNDPAQASNHVQQALIAIGSGGLFGVGPGASRQKFGYLPFPHTDSVFAVLGEELGLIGGLVVLILFAFVAYRGFRIALHAPDAFGTLAAVGVTCWVSIEALINVAVITGTVPFTGISLPFISYGGSSLLSLLAAVGLLQSIAHGTRKGLTRSALVDRGRRNGRSRLSRVSSR
ncbi:MAG TPA: putative lipid II flippase FtsW [Anaerolineae bacterium]|nr:putative lipid II flippase FtsW [Anaerolineae bacterium]